MTRILAQLSRDDRLKAISERLEETSSPTTVLIMVAVILMVAVMLYLIHRMAVRARSSVRNNPKRLFHEVCLGIELEAAQKLLIQRISRDLQLHQPVLMVMTPSSYDAHVEKWVAQHGSLSSETRTSLDEIRQRLFGPPLS